MNEFTDNGAEPDTLTAGQMIRLQVFQEIARSPEYNGVSVEQMLADADDVAVWVITGGH
jgi:hypothetical protein